MWLPQFSVWSRFGGDKVTPFSFWSPSAGGFILLSSTSRAKTWAGNSCGMAQISSQPNVKLKLWRQQGPFTLSIHGFSRSKHRHSNSLEPSRGEESTCGLHSMDSEVWVLAPNIFFLENISHMTPAYVFRYSWHVRKIYLVWIDLTGNSVSVQAD